MKNHSKSNKHRGNKEKTKLYCQPWQTVANQAVKDYEKEKNCIEVGRENRYIARAIFSQRTHNAIVELANNEKYGYNEAAIINTIICYKLFDPECHDQVRRSLLSVIYGDHPDGGYIEITPVDVRMLKEHFDNDK